MSDGYRKLLLILAAIIVGGILLRVGSTLTLPAIPALPNLELYVQLAFMVGGFVVLLVTFIIVVISFYFSKDCEPCPPTKKEQGTLPRVVFGAGLLVCATFVWAGFFVGFNPDSSDIALPVVIIAGLVVLVMVLGLLTFAFSVLKLSDSKEALGLPSGSIRAVIALMLLVVFAIVAIFLYSDVASSGKMGTATGIAATKLPLLQKQFEVIDWVEEEAKKAPAGDAVTNAPAPEKRYTVYYRNRVSAAAQDLAKQLIVLLGTLVTAVSSFYFGASSIAAVTKPSAGTGGPDAKAVTPRELKLNTPDQVLTITGANLGNVIGVQLDFDDQDAIIAAGVSASETKIECKVTTKADTKPGPWTVVVSDNANNSSKIPNIITVAAKPAESGSSSENTEQKLEPSSKDIEKVQEITLKNDGTAQELKVAPIDVAKVKSLRLKNGDAHIDANDGTIKPANGGLTCQITVSVSAEEEGLWDIAVSDGTTETVVPGKKVRIES